MKGLSVLFLTVSLILIGVLIWITLPLKVVAWSVPSPGTSPASLAPMLYGDGQSGKRVQAVYVHPSGTPDRLDKPFIPAIGAIPSNVTFRTMIQMAAGYIDAAYLASTEIDDSGAYRRIFWLTDPSGMVDVRDIAIAPNTTGETETLAQLGRPDRLFLAWYDGSLPGASGSAGWVADDQPGPQNASNSGNRYAVGDFPAAFDVPDWVHVHELTHLFGAVQHNAPNSTLGSHVTSVYDVMTGYGEPGTGSPICSSDTQQHTWRLDTCGDSYFNPSPKSGGYLASHWNVANSVFLANAPATVSSPSPTTTPPSIQPPAGSFVSVVPVRLLDTRNSVRIGQGESRELAIAGVNFNGAIPVPIGASTVILNVTEVNGSAPSFLTIYPSDAIQPTTSNLNWGINETAPRTNQVTVKLSGGGKIQIYNAMGTVDVIVDLQGWFT